MTTSRLLLLVLVLAAGLPAAVPPPAVPRWGRFEAVVPSSRPDADPLREVSLEVTFTRPDGTTVPFWGFHDGARGWKIRFRPDQPGQWRYAATFSDGRPGASGSFPCVDSGLAGPIAVHAANPVWFGRAGGDALLVRGLHVGDRFFARNWDDPANETDGNRRSAFLDWAKAQGYNLLSVASHYLNRSAPGRGEGWDTPRLWPLDAAEFQRLELILDDLANRGFSVYPFAGFFGRDSNFPRAAADQTRYLRHVLARFAPYGHLLFNVAGPEPLLRGKPYLTIEEVNRLGAEIARLDPFAHPLSVHNATGDDAFKDAPWLTYGTLQGPKTFSRRALSAGLLKNHHPAKPLLAQETLWSGNSIHMKRNGADYSDADLRKNAFAIHFCAAALVFADNDGDSSSGFSGSLDPAQRRQPRHDIVRRVWDTLAALPWQRTRPHPELVTATDNVTALCLAEPGETYLVYLEARATVEVRTVGGPFAVEWIDAQNPARRHRGGKTAPGARLTPPSGGDDWLLVLRRLPDRAP
jgi:hypothetical protein